MNKEKFYYIDKDGNKKKYYGKVIQENGLYSGILTIQEKQVNDKKELIYHPEIEEVEGYFSYYSYINNAGEDIRYYNNIKKDENGEIYFTYTERNIYPLEYHEEVTPKEEYYTYIDKATGEEKLYSGKVIYDRLTNTYSGILKK